MKVFFENQVKEYDPEVEYVFEFISQHPFSQNLISIEDKSNADISIGYNTDDTCDVLIPNQKLIFSENSVDCSILLPGQYSFGDKKLYSVQLERPLIGEFVSQTKSTIHIGFDIIETIFFHISRYEEYKATPEQKDELGRVVETNLFCIRNSIEKRPIVDDLVAAFLVVIGVEPSCLKPKSILTHDIDHVRAFKHIGSAIKRAAIMSYRGVRFSKIMKMLSTYLSVRFSRIEDPFSNTAFLSDANIEKHIFLLVGGTHKYDTPLQLNDPLVQSMIDIAVDMGYHFGIHPSISASRNAALWKFEKELLEQKLNSKLTQSRQHYLCYDLVNTSKIIEENNIKREFTMGYGRHVGFRSGTAVDHRLYNFEERRHCLFLSSPLTVMDTALWFEAGGDINKFDQIWEQFHSVNKETIQITYNFHNSTFYDLSCFGLDLGHYYNQITGES